MKINTKYHGTREYIEEDIVTFKRGIPGFENLTKFIVFPLEENDFFNIFHSIEDENIGLVTVSPFSINSSYEINLDENILSDLNISSEKDVLILTTVTLNSKIENITVNLKAPIVINIVERLGEQIILDKMEYSIKHPLLQES
jgi:flagellar assembly factor FliW